MTDRSCDLRIGHIAPWIIFPVEGKNAGMGLAFLLPFLMQHEKITDIGCEQHILLGSRIAEISFILGASHRYGPRGYDLMVFMLKQADELIPIQVIIEVESHD